MSDVKELLKGGYDLHVHSAPDCLPRKMDDIDMAERITASTLSGYAIKNHWTSTAGRAKLINRLYPGCDAIGTITLNSAVGGLNPTAVEMAARGGVKLVWFPTCDNEHEAAYQFDGNPNKKLAFWASIILEMKEQGIQTPTQNCLDENGELKQEVLDILADSSLDAAAREEKLQSLNGGRTWAGLVSGWMENLRCVKISL
jgi:hypothetical protein